MKRSIVFFIVLMLTANAIAASEFSTGIDYRGEYSDNIFMNTSAVKDYINQLRADVSFSQKNVNLYLDTSADLYLKNPDFNSYSLEPGFAGYFSLKGRNTVFFDLSYPVLHYKNIYTDFNYSGPIFQAGLKLFPAPKMILKAGYRLESRNYFNFGSFDFANHTAFIELSRVFSGQTTVRVAIRYNYRLYPHVIDNFDFGEGYNYYNGKMHQGGKTGNHNDGSNSGSGPGHTIPPAQLTTSRISIPNLHSLLRITRGFGTHLGITVEAEARKNYSGLENAETIIKNAYVLYPFNDDFLWDGLRISVIAQWVLGNLFSLDAQISYYDKGYSGVFTRDSEGNIVEPALEREDSLWLYRLNLSGKLGKFSMFATASFYDNDSNDNYFRYTMLTISAGLGIRF